CGWGLLWFGVVLGCFFFCCGGVGVVVFWLGGFLVVVSGWVGGGVWGFGWFLCVVVCGVVVCGCFVGWGLLLFGVLCLCVVVWCVVVGVGVVLWWLLGGVGGWLFLVWLLLVCGLVGFVFVVWVLVLVVCGLGGVLGGLCGSVVLLC
ncbi:hypothetical protein, partial [Neisseria sp. P0024.S006]|uniref:hypothetical protein n=1 Tax=Neisseria sp. P0024.S006 TaxID=3436850 RepID=UPI003F7DEAD4